jgi:hypothetical protein
LKSIKSKNLKKKFKKKNHPFPFLSPHLPPPRSYSKLPEMSVVSDLISDPIYINDDDDVLLIKLTQLAYSQIQQDQQQQFNALQSMLLRDGEESLWFFQRLGNQLTSFEIIIVFIAFFLIFLGALLFLFGFFIFEQNKDGLNKIRNQVVESHYYHEWLLEYQKVNNANNSIKKPIIEKPHKT